MPQIVRTRISLVLAACLVGLLGGIETASAAERCGGRRATITANRGGQTKGTPGADVIVGTSGRDKIDGRGGADRICARGGADSLTGAGGNDLLFGESGNDVLDGGDGDDMLAGGGGIDITTFAGSPGPVVANVLFSAAGNGDDLLFGIERAIGSPEGDRLCAQSPLPPDVCDETSPSEWGDRVILDGGDGDDALFGSEGPDVLVGGRGNDVAVGGGGNDLLVGDAHSVPSRPSAAFAQARDDVQAPSEDVLEGGPGDDVALGGAGENEFDGGAGENTCANVATSVDCAGPPAGAPTAESIVATFSFPVTTYTFDVTDPGGEAFTTTWLKGASFEGEDRNCGSFTYAGEVARWSHAHEPPDNCPSESLHPGTIFVVAVDDVGWSITNIYADGSAEGRSAYEPMLRPPTIANWEG